MRWFTHSAIEVHIVVQTAYTAMTAMSEANAGDDAATISWCECRARINTISQGIIVTPLAYDEFNANGAS